MKSFDSVIIGSGQAGPSLSVALATRGQRVALVEGASLGGTCVNTGCTPTKTLRKSARVAHMARRAAEFGVRVGEVEVDFGAAMARMRARSDASRSSVERNAAAFASMRSSSSIAVSTSVSAACHTGARTALAKSSSAARRPVTTWCPNTPAVEDMFEH